jgi:hypothetical protein
MNFFKKSAPAQQQTAARRNHPSLPPRYQRWLQSLSRNEDGQSIIELALTLPILMTFSIGFMQICMAFYIHEAISEEVREGTRYAMVRGSSCLTSGGASCTATAADVNTVVSGIGFVNPNSGSMVVNTTYPDGNENPGSRVKVSVQFVFGLSIPFTSIQPISMSTSSTMYIIQ